MRRFLLKINAFIKGFILFLRPHILLSWLRHPFLTASNTIALSKWISTQNKEGILDDFYTTKRVHSRRYKLYEFVSEKIELKNEPVDYLEFGVFEANSFKWWLKSCVNTESRFYGFDTFEGLPEKWGTYGQGEMSAGLPVIDDSRGQFVKGLFQDTLPGFLETVDLKNGKRKIIHLDADLFSSTLFALTSLAPYLKKGDILLFDEFNVPNHEFLAFKMFSDSFYVKTKLLGAVNNYYQIALMIE